MKLGRVRLVRHELLVDALLLRRVGLDARLHSIARREIFGRFP